MKVAWRRSQPMLTTRGCQAERRVSALRPSESRGTKAVRFKRHFTHSLVTILSVALGFLAAPELGAQDSKAVSYFKEVVPIFKRSCNGCHHPGKLKGDLDLTTYAALQKGGKHGASF